MLHPRMKYIYVGVDSHKETHTAVILDCFNEKLGEVKFNNIPSEFESTLKKLEKYVKEGQSLAFGIEDVTAYGRALTVFLTSKKILVKHVNAALVAQERKSNNLEKTDRNDAECAANILIKKFEQLPYADTQDKYYVLSQLVTRRKSIVRNNTNLKNHLQAYITSHYPSYTKFFTNIDCKSALAFYDKYPSPSKLEGVTEKDLEQFFKDVTEGRQYKGKAERIFEYVIRDGSTKTEYQEIRDLAVKSTISQINSNKVQIQEIDAILEGFLDKFEYRLQTMAGIDTVMAARFIAEIGDISKFPTHAKLARYAGIAPVTNASGKNEKQYADKRGNRELNSLFFKLAVAVTSPMGKNKKLINPILYEYYQKKASEPNKTKRMALKSVQRVLVNIIWGMMKNNRGYINPPSQNCPPKKEAS